MGSVKGLRREARSILPRNGDFSEARRAVAALKVVHKKLSEIFRVSAVKKGVLDGEKKTYS